MRTNRSKLMLLPLIPALAFGIVEVASKISMLTSAPDPTPVVVVEVPVKRIVIEQPPAPPAPPTPEPECRGCVTST